MIHAYLGITRKPIGKLKDQIEQGMNVTFCGDDEAVKYWKNKVKEAKIFDPSTHKMEMKEIANHGMKPIPTQEALDGMRDHFVACLTWFAVEGFTPAGGAGDERIFFFNGK
jgi:hypothetical protein